MIAGVAGVGASAAAAAAATPTAGSVAPLRSRRGLQTVRLVTGDRVTVRGSDVVEFQRGRAVDTSPILRYVADGDLYVVPAASMPLIEAGRVDERLFNVTGLARVGYHDARHADPATVSAVPVPALARRRDEAYQVRAVLWDRAGASPVPDARGYNEAWFLDPATNQLLGRAPDRGYASLPAGEYRVVSAITTPDPRAPAGISHSLVVVPRLVVAADTTVTLDARMANRISVSVPDSGAEPALGLVGVGVSTPGRTGENYLAGFDISVNRYLETYAGSPPGVTDQDLIFYHRQMLQEPELKVAVVAPRSFAVRAEWYVLSPRLVGVRSLAAVHVGSGSPQELAGLVLRGRLALLDLPPEQGAEFPSRLRDLAAAGALAALHIGASPPSPYEPDLALPVGFAVGPDARALGDAATASGATVRWHGIDGSPYRYDLSFPARGAVPAQLRHDLRGRDLARIRVTYAAQGAPSPGGTGASAYFHGVGIGAGGAARVPRPLVRDEYVTPGEWTLNSTGYYGLEQAWQAPTRYLADRGYTVRWQQAVLGPGFPPGTADALHGVVRAGDDITSGLSMVCDGQGNLGEMLPWAAETGAVTLTQTLYRDGELVGRSDLPSAATFPVPPAAARYELRARLARNGPWWQTATAIEAAWTFTSGHTDAPAVLPLLTVQATADVDASNTTRPGTLHLPIRLHRQDLQQPPAGGELAAEYSSEDGRTWRAAPVSRTASGVWTARLHSAGRGYLSLRFHARDRQGNTLTQTVIRAIRIR